MVIVSLNLFNPYRTITIPFLGQSPLISKIPQAVCEIVDELKELKEVKWNNTLLMAMPKLG